MTDHARILAELSGAKPSRAPAQRGGRPRMGKGVRVVVHATVDPTEAEQLQKWAGARPVGHAVGALVKHGQRTKFRPKDYFSK